MRDLGLGLLDLELLALADRLLLDRERGVVAGVEGDRAVVDVEDVGRDVVEEALIVADRDRAALVAREEPLEPADGEDVEVVGRLVEQKHVGPAEEHLREQHAQLEAARERRERHEVLPHRDAEALEDEARARLQRVAVVRADDLFELGDPRGVRAVVRERPLLGERAPHDHVALRRRRRGSGPRRAGTGPAGARPPVRASFGMLTEPLVGWSSPARMLRNVVFPEPFAPTRP